MHQPDFALPPYAALIGIALDGWEDGRPRLAIDFAPRVCGNPGTFHGGALGALLDQAARGALARVLPAGAVPGLLNITVEYIRSATDARTLALGEVVRIGKRLANVRASAWQGSPDRIVATAICNFAIAPG